VAQGVGPEFKPQYHKKRRKEGREGKEREGKGREGKGNLFALLINVT
jgi:hypothetical protein